MVNCFLLQLWIKNNNVLAIVFRDNLHQPQYVEKLDRLVRFCIKEKVLGMEDLDRIWASQDGKHEMIVKNIHDMLVKLAWDFSPEQLEYLFGCFQVQFRNILSTFLWTLQISPPPPQCNFSGAGWVLPRNSAMSCWILFAIWQRMTRKGSWLLRWVSEGADTVNISY